MKYMLLIYSNPDSWAELSHEQRVAVGRGHADLHQSLIDSARHVVSEGLSDEINTKTVRVRNAVVSATDGPYVEAKEHLAGFYVVECADIEEASTIATLIPDAAIDFVEVRPVLDPPML